MEPLNIISLKYFIQVGKKVGNQSNLLEYEHILQKKKRNISPNTICINLQGYFRETKAETVNSRSDTFQMSSIHNHHPYKRQRERKKKS